MNHTVTHVSVTTRAQIQRIAAGRPVHVLAVTNEYPPVEVRVSQAALLEALADNRGVTVDTEDCGDHLIAHLVYR